MPRTGTVIATRSALLKYELLSQGGNPFATITLKNGIWPAESAPLTPFLPNIVTNHPELTVDGRNFVAHRRLVSNNMMLNNFEIRLSGDGGESAISAQSSGRSWTTPISHAGATYDLRRKSAWRFSFDLRAGSGDLATFRDTTPFWTFNAKRRFALDLSHPVDDLLLTFSFFLATSIIFRS